MKIYNTNNGGNDQRKSVKIINSPATQDGTYYITSINGFAIFQVNCYWVVKVSSYLLILKLAGTAPRT